MLLLRRSGVSVQHDTTIIRIIYTIGLAQTIYGLGVKYLMLLVHIAFHEEI